MLIPFSCISHTVKYDTSFCLKSKAQFFTLGPSSCQRHSILVQNMLQLMADKAQALSRRVDVLSRRSIREKLLCYFRQLSQQAGNRTFTIRAA